jgi:hypothetical protein
VGKGLDFLASALKQETDDCIEWPYYRMKNGYGQVGTNTNMKLAHRYLCEMAHGPGGPQAAHSCGNRGCVNKRHIRWVTQTTNEMDKHNHGTWWARLSSNKISEATALAIKTDLKSLLLKAVAEKHGVSAYIVKHIKYGEAWRHI